MPPLGLHYEELRSLAPSGARSLFSSHAGSVLLLAGVVLCGAGLAVDDERAALGLVMTGIPLAIFSFFVGLACANCGDRASALFLARSLVLSGVFFCLVGALIASSNHYELWKAKVKKAVGYGKEGKDEDEVDEHTKDDPPAVLLDGGPCCEVLQPLLYEEVVLPEGSQQTRRTPCHSRPHAKYGLGPSHEATAFANLPYHID